METLASSDARPGMDAEEARGELVVHLHGDGPALWQALLEQWSELEQSSLILPGNFARDRFVRINAQQTIWGERRVQTLMALWTELAGCLGRKMRVPGELLAPQVEPALAAAIADTSRLRELLGHERGLQALSEHLSWVEKQADLDYAPTNDLEREIAALRDGMVASGLVLAAARRSFLARNAKLAELGRPLIFTPLPELNRQLGGLLKGLGRRNEIHLHMLAPHGLAQTALDICGLDSEARIVDERDAGGGVGIFNPAWSAPEERVSFLLAEDDGQAALELAAGWVREGVQQSQIAIVCPDLDRIDRGLSSIARGLGLTLLLRDSVSTHESILATLLLRLGRGEREELMADGAPLGLGEEHLAALEKAGSDAERLQAIYRIGSELLERGYERLAAGEPAGFDPGRAGSWLDGLRVVADSVQEQAVEPWNLADLIGSTRGLRVVRGDLDGICLISYAEAASLQLENAIFIGLSTEGAEGYPPQRQGSAFASAELLERCPKLAPADLRPEFAAAVAAVPARMAFIGAEGEGESPSPFWREAKRAFAAGEISSEGSDPGRVSAPRRRARSAARRRERLHEEIERALSQAGRERLPESVGGQRRRSYSVTELEAYLRCPYGWFVQHVLAPAAPASSKQLRGTVLHDVLAQLMELPVPAAERPQYIEQLLMASEAPLDEREIGLMADQLRAVLDRYGSDSWPFGTHYCEYSLRVEIPDGEEGVLSINGRVDRLDLRTGPSGERELLVIDYKSSLPTGSDRDRLQPFIYPWMAQRALKLDHSRAPLGAIYIGIRDCSQTGYLSREIGGIDLQGLSIDWERRHRQARHRMLEAIAGIEAGEWSQTGKRCPEWCPHRLLSETGESR